MKHSSQIYVAATDDASSGPSSLGDYRAVVARAIFRHAVADMRRTEASRILQIAKPPLRSFPRPQAMGPVYVTQCSGSALAISLRFWKPSAFRHGQANSQLTPHHWSTVPVNPAAS